MDKSSDAAALLARCGTAFRASAAVGIGLGWVGFGCVGLGWIGLSWDGFGWVELT